MIDRIYNKHIAIICMDCGEIILHAHITRKRCNHCAKIAQRKQSNEARQRNIENVRKKGAERKRIAYRRNPEKFKINNFKWRENHREEERERLKKWRENNREKSRQAVKDYQMRNVDKISEYKERTKEKRRERVKQYNLKHPDLRRARENRKRARKLNAFGSHTIAEFRNLCEIKGWECSYCGQKLTAKTVTRDHIISLAKGGVDSIDNITPSCLKCNVRKNTKSIEEFGAFLEKISLHI